MEADDILLLMAYRAGLKRAVTDYAVWNNGTQYVGVMRRPLQEVLREIDERHDNELLKEALIDMGRKV